MNGIIKKIRLFINQRLKKLTKNKVFLKILKKKQRKLIYLIQNKLYIKKNKLILFKIHLKILILKEIKLSFLIIEYS